MFLAPTGFAVKLSGGPVGAVWVVKENRNYTCNLVHCRTAVKIKSLGYNVYFSSKLQYSFGVKVMLYYLACAK